LEEKQRRQIRGVKVGRSMALTHILFVDDVFIFFMALIGKSSKVMDILNLYCVGSNMDINLHKLTFYANELDEQLLHHLGTIFPFGRKNLDEGVKYLEFIVNPNKFQRVE
jgi:hypothetical protein